MKHFKNKINLKSYLLMTNTFWKRSLASCHYLYVITLSDSWYWYLDTLISPCRMKRVMRDSWSMWTVQWRFPVATLMDSLEAVFISSENLHLRSPDLDIISLSAWVQTHECDNLYAARANAADREVLVGVDQLAVKEEDCFWWTHRRKFQTWPANRRRQRCHRSTEVDAQTRCCDTVSTYFYDYVILLL